MAAPIKKEVTIVIRRNIITVVVPENIYADHNIFLARFVLQIKSANGWNMIFKALSVIGGHLDMLKKLMVLS